MVGYGTNKLVYVINNNDNYLIMNNTYIRIYVYTCYMNILHVNVCFLNIRILIILIQYSDLILSKLMIVQL